MQFQVKDRFPPTELCESVKRLNPAWTPEYCFWFPRMNFIKPTVEFTDTAGNDQEIGCDGTPQASGAAPRCGSLGPYLSGTTGPTPYFSEKQDVDDSSDDETPYRKLTASGSKGPYLGQSFSWGNVMETQTYSGSLEIVADSEINGYKQNDSRFVITTTYTYTGTPPTDPALPDYPPQGSWESQSFSLPADATGTLSIPYTAAEIDALLAAGYAKKKTEFSTADVWQFSVRDLRIPSDYSGGYVVDIRTLDEPSFVGYDDPFVGTSAGTTGLFFKFVMLGFDTGTYRLRVKVERRTHTKTNPETLEEDEDEDTYGNWTRRPDLTATAIVTEINGYGVSTLKVEESVKGYEYRYGRAEGMEYGEFYEYIYDNMIPGSVIEKIS